MGVRGRTGKGANGVDLWDPNLGQVDPIPVLLTNGVYWYFFLNEL